MEFLSGILKVGFSENYGLNIMEIFISKFIRAFLLCVNLETVTVYLPAVITLYESIVRFSLCSFYDIISIITTRHF